MKNRLLMAMVAVALLFAACSKETQSASNQDPQVGNPSAGSTAQFAHLSVHLPDRDPWHLEDVEIGQDSKVRDLLLKANAMSPELQFKDTLYTGMGHLLTSLLGLANSKGEGAYWQFCIDNQTSNVGIDEKEVKAGQRVEWYYVTYGQLPCKKIGE